MKFEIVIGDWSGDGHGMFETLVVETTKDVEDFRDAYVAFGEKHPDLNLEEICCDYEDSSIPTAKANKFKELGLDLDSEWNEDEDRGVYMNADGLAKLMMDACQLMNPELDYKFVNTGIPTFHNYGWDKKGRHIHGPGYGCFSL